MGPFLVPPQTKTTQIWPNIDPQTGPTNGPQGQQEMTRIGTKSNGTILKTVIQIDPTSAGESHIDLQGGDKLKARR